MIPSSFFHELQKYNIFDINDHSVAEVLDICKYLIKSENPFSKQQYIYSKLKTVNIEDLQRLNLKQVVTILPESQKLPVLILLIFYFSVYCKDTKNLV